MIGKYVLVYVNNGYELGIIKEKIGKEVKVQIVGRDIEIIRELKKYCDIQNDGAAYLLKERKSRLSRAI